MKHQFKVKKSEHGVRLQKFLHDKMSTWSHKKIKQAIDKKRAFVNGKNVFISNWNLKAGDQVFFNAPVSDYPQEASLGRYHYVDVIYEDDAMLVTNKPAFIDYDTFVEQVNAYLRRVKGKGFHPYLGQMHRLDKETSGLLLFTKKKAANVLSDQFRERTIRKTYFAIVCGQLDEEHGIIKKRIEKIDFEDGKKVRIADGNHGQSSHTEYWVLERYDHATFAKVFLKTGRTHQIRVHFADMGHPLVGDKIYGEVKNTAFPIKRQALHAAMLEFKHPVTGNKMRCQAPLPADFENLLNHLRLQQ